MVYNTDMNIYLSEDSHPHVKAYLVSQGHRLCEIKKSGAVYDAIAAHADIYLCKVQETLFIAKEQYSILKEALERESLPWIIGREALGDSYPGNIKYNAVQLGNHFIHHTKYTAQDVLEKAQQAGLNIISVKQGYTKCNMVVVDENSVITSDPGLARSLITHNINTLLISQGHVTLEGFAYGFLGGASGRVGREILFHGNLSLHPDYEQIKRFIEKQGLIIKYFKEFPLTDIGSILTGGTP